MSGQPSDEDQQLLADVLELLDRDTELSDEAKCVVYAAMESDAELASVLGGATAPSRPPAVEISSDVQPVGAFLKAVTVRGFRGIGPTATLQLHPAAGLTVVAGRNGSGKSSFSEALEFAITGHTYRWDAKKSKTTWAEYWRNLHDGTPCEVVIEIAEDGIGITKVGVQWPDGADLDHPTTWVQRPGKPRQSGTAGLGWERAITTYRPILSYDELGGLLEASPSTLFDRLDALLGLHRLKVAQDRLSCKLKELQWPDKQVKEAAKALKDDLAELEDERATDALALLRKRSPDLGALQALATGTAAQPSAELVALRGLAELRLPGAEEVATALSVLRQAQEAFVAAGTVSVEQSERRADLLGQALEFHRHLGDGKCPVCGTGDLDTSWRDRAERELTAERAEIALRRQTRQALDSARRAVVGLVLSVGQLVTPTTPTLVSLPTAHEAWQRWSDLPTDTDGLLERMASAHDDLVVAFGMVRDEAVALLAEREDTWAPLAVRLAEWVSLATATAGRKPTVELAEAAASFLVKAGARIRQTRLSDIETKAREIWAALRQDSNVDLGGIELKGQGTRRRVELHAAVDGAQAQALGVMSQGELHALALALFLPRATMPDSPFRFIVLDDPIQAMDPAKVDGFVRVLTDLAKYRQVIVLSHDDRLPQVIRQLDVDARIVEVCRDTNSIVTVTDCEDPAQRYLDDAFALTKDTYLPSDVKMRVLPNLCRMAVEVAARDRYFANRINAGESRDAVEDQWQQVKKTAPRVALAINGKPDISIDPWLDRCPYRRNAYRTITKAVHQGLTGDPTEAVRQVERFVQDLRAGKK